MSKKILVIFSFIFFSNMNKNFACSNNLLKSHSIKLEGGFNFCVPCFTKNDFMEYFPQNSNVDKMEEVLPFMTGGKFIYNYFVNPWVGLGGGVAVNYNQFGTIQKQSSKNESGKEVLGERFSLIGWSTEFFYRVYFNFLKESRLVGSEKNLSCGGFLDLGYMMNFFELFQAYIDEENKVESYSLGFPECSCFPNTFLNKFKNLTFGLGVDVGYKGVYFNVAYRGVWAIGGMIVKNEEKKICNFIGGIGLTLGYDFAELLVNAVKNFPPSFKGICV